MVFKRARIVSTPLEFSFDFQEGYTEILVIQIRPNGKTPVKDISEFWRHGFVQGSKGVKHLIEHEDLRLLLAIKSTNPSIDLNGVIRFEFNPSILQYVREKKTSIVETESSKNIIISVDGMKKRADVSYNPRSGLLIKTGYQISGMDEIIPKNQLRKTSDPDYVRIDGAYYPAPEEHNERLNDFIDRGEIRVDDDRIDDFFERDLEFLKTNFDVINNFAEKQIENIRRLKSILREML